MASALKDTGSTRRWRRLRAHYAQQLPLPCPYCGLMVEPGQRWELDHELPRALGGEDDRIRPVHWKCNRRAGAALRNARRRPSPFVGAMPKNDTTMPAETFARGVLTGAESRDRDW